MLVTGNLVSTEWKIGSLLTSYINTKDHRRRDSRVSEVTFYSVVVIMMVEFSSSSSQDGGGNTRHLVKPVTWQRGNQMPLEGEGFSGFDGQYLIGIER